MERQRIDWLILVAAIAGAGAWSSGAVWAADKKPYELIAKGNEALAGGEYDAALDLYEQAAKAMPDSPELAYNEAVARYRKGEWAKAADLFSKALVSGNAALEGKARFNLGNCAYAEALAKKEQPAEAIKPLGEAITHYRAAVKANPDDPDPRVNLETAAVLLKQLKEQQEQEQQQKDQENPSSQPESQPESQPQSQPASRPQSQPEDQQSQEQEKQQQQKQDAENQQSEQSQQDQANQDKQEGSETKDGEKLEAQDQQGEEGQEDKQAKPGEPVEARLMTREEAEKLLQIIRDRERQRREALAQQERQQAKPNPAEKDW